MITINNSDAVISSYKGNKKKYIYNKISRTVVGRIINTAAQSLPVHYSIYSFRILSWLLFRSDWYLKKKKFFKTELMTTWKYESHKHEYFVCSCRIINSV